MTAWTYRGHLGDLPYCLRPFVRFVRGLLMLDRNSGLQEIRLNETIRMGADGEPEHDIPGAKS